jgi:hypothetical protein
MYLSVGERASSSRAAEFGERLIGLIEPGEVPSGTAAR